MSQSLKLHIFGASGAGTTTLGVALAEHLRARYFDSDAYFWQPTDPPFTTPRPREDRIALLSQDLAGVHAWVLSGSMIGWGDALVSEFTLAVYLRIPPEVRMQRIVARERQRYGARIEVGGDMHSQSRQFIEWAQRYDTAGFEQRSHALHEFWMQALPCRLLRIEYDAPVATWLEAVVNALDQR